MSALSVIEAVTGVREAEPYVCGTGYPVRDTAGTVADTDWEPRGTAHRGTETIGAVDASNARPSDAADEIIGT